jgi:Tol biopolymer transport system component
MRRSVALLAVGLTASLVVTEEAQSSYPGRNGELAFGSIHPELCQGIACDPVYEVNVVRHRGGTSHLLACDAGAPAFSADGRRVAFSRVSGGLLVARTDGGGKPRAVPGTADGRGPIWSPSGKRLLFTAATGNGPDYDVFTIHIDGTRRQQLTSDGRSVAEDWSANGRVLFSKFRGKVGLYSMSPAGTNKRRLTRPRPTSDDPPRTVADRNASWSPDGQRIVFTRDSDFVYDVMTARADGKHVGSFVHAADQSTWSPDGRRIAYVHVWGNKVYTRRADGSGPARRFATQRPHAAKQCDGATGRGGPQDTKILGLDWQPLPR